MTASLSEKLLILHVKPVAKEGDMTKADLVAAFANAADLSKVRAEECLEKLAYIMLDELKEDGEIRLPRLGKLQVVRRAARCGRNPRTGEAVPIAPRRAVKFSAGKYLKDCMRHAVG